MCIEESMLDRLVRRRNNTTQELNNLNEAIAALEANPAVCDVIVKLSRVTDRLR